MVPFAMLLVAVSLGAPTEEAPATPQLPRTVAGKVAEVRLAEGAMSLEVRDGSLRLQIDRNTAVFLPGRQGTLRDIAAGEPARASLGASGIAHWIEIHPRGVMPTARSGQPSPATPSK